MLLFGRQIGKDYTYFSIFLLTKLIPLQHKKPWWPFMRIIFFQFLQIAEYPIVEMKGSNLVSLTDCPLPQVFPLPQLLSSKCSHRQKRATPSCESINSWRVTHWVKNILWKKKRKPQIWSYTTELKGMLANWDLPRQFRV